MLHVLDCVDFRERCPDPGHRRHLQRGGLAQGLAAAARDRRPLVAFVAFHFLTHLVLSAINCSAVNGKM